MELTLLWAALTGVALLWVGTKLWSERLGERPLDDLIGAALGGLVVGRLAAMTAQGVNPLANPFDIIVVRAGVHTGAAVIGAIAVFAWSVRDRLQVIDAAAPAALLGVAGWHAGCVWRSACLGTASQLPWAWSTSGGAVDRHPVELYAAAVLAIAAWAVSRLGWRQLWRAGWALALVSLVRLVTEPMRPSLGGGPMAWYAAGVLLGALALVAGPLLASRVSLRST